jgi:hypothetical protein
MRQSLPPKDLGIRFSDAVRFVPRGLVTLSPCVRPARLLALSTSHFRMSFHLSRALLTLQT